MTDTDSHDELPRWRRLFRRFVELAEVLDATPADQHERRLAALEREVARLGDRSGPGVTP